MLLAHPEAENLGRFVEGTLDDPERAAIVDHIADCDDCRILVVDAAEFIEPAKVERHSSWWMGIAASLMIVAAIGGLTYHQLRDQLRDVKKEYAELKFRPVAARLSGFAYRPYRTVRGGSDDELDPALFVMQAKAAEAAEGSGNDAKSFHTRGVGLLLTENGATESIAPLQAAAARDPNNATYQSDLAAALIAARPNDKTMLAGALAACDRALRIDPKSPDALFNRAVALKYLGRPDDASVAYERYLKVDATSPWADEARKNVEPLPLP